MDSQRQGRFWVVGAAIALLLAHYPMIRSGFALSQGDFGDGW